MKPTFEHIGPTVEYGDVRIDEAAGELFRKTALLGTRLRRLHIGDVSTQIETTSYATGMLSDAASDYEVDEVAYFSRSTGWQNPEYWQSKMTFARYNQKHADTKIYTIYEAEYHGGEVTSAVRRVRIIRNLTRLAFEDGEPVEDTYSRQHKAFEVPMEPDDVTSVAIAVDRIMRRQKARPRA